MTSILRIVRAGLFAALAIGLAGWSIERLRFGATDQTALALVERELHSQLDSTAELLGRIAARVSSTPDAVRAAQRDSATAGVLFDEAAAALGDEDSGRTGISIYAGDGAPVAWAGRVFDLPKERLNAGPSLFVAPGALGPRLVRVSPLASHSAARDAVVVVEQSLGSRTRSAVAPDAFILSTSLGDVELRAVLGRAAADAAGALVIDIPNRAGGLLVEAELSAADLAAARVRWRRGTLGAMLAIVGLTVLLCAGPLMERRRLTAAAGPFLGYTAALVAVLTGAFVFLTTAAAAIANATADPGSASVDTSPVVILLGALTLLALVALALDVVERRRVSRPRPALVTSSRGERRVVIVYAVAGVAAAVVLAAYEQALRKVVANTSLDVLHFSLHPLGAARLAVAFGLVLLHAAAIWSAVVFARWAGLWARTPRATRPRTLIAAAWTVGAVSASLAAAAWLRDVPFAPLCVALGAAAGCAAATARISGRLRRASQAARLGVLFLALLAPALAMYPSLFAFATEAKEQLVETSYGPEALSQREDLQRRLQQTVDEIDSFKLSEFVSGADDTPTTDRAFVVWSRTELAKYRLTSAVELYNAAGGLVSRFALHLPEYSTIAFRAPRCAWEPLLDEVSPFGSSERHVLRTSRGICEGGRLLGSVVVRVMLDYRSLPFMAAESPYLESLNPSREQPQEGISGRDVEFAVFGWSRAPLLESGTTVWRLPDPVFDRLVQSREPFWATLQRGDETDRVYFLSDRGEIYALGYPVITWSGQVINLAELVLLAFVLYAILLTAGALFSAATGRTPATGRELLREVRSSFYRKLFIAYVAGAVVPVVILAFAIRTYFATQLRAGAEEAALHTVTTAQRLVEDYAAIQQAGATALSTVDDQSMVLVRRAIDEDVNLFDRSRLQATSARDLFATLLLSTRTPGDVFKAILIDRAPTFIGDEAVGGVRYRLAAAPVRAGGREGIVTVPLTTRQQEIEQQIDELDRRVRAAAVVFSLFGAAIGYWLAERIADPVNRLTRATRRIARGDLNARIAATSSDELRRLVEDFNQMAADLQRQRTELEHTQRLQAWADMARQVAHDIKNPLTPIQLSAEHARRVNQDRGRPLSPALDECVNAILTQVKLLRQISAEFSSFASSPTARPEPTDVPALIEEVVEPYRTGLTGRIAIDVRQPEAPAIATIDRTLFARALTNVIENALHAMPGTGTLTITARDGAAGLRDRVVVEINDTGVGMDQEALNRIFEPYFSTKATGTGLGLTIAKRNVELNGGTIAVKSERGVGTTVTITLPVSVSATVH